MLAAIAAALDGAELTRAELAEAVAARVGEPALAGPPQGGFGDLLKPAAFTGDLASRPATARACASRARPTGWAVGSPGARAGRERLVRTYLRAYGRRRASSSSAGSA